MAYVIPEGTKVVVELKSGKTKQLSLPIDLRREWGQRTTTVCESDSGNESFMFRFTNGIVVRIICDARDVMAFSPRCPIARSWALAG
jgi:hypothetical protein